MSTLPRFARIRGFSLLAALPFMGMMAGSASGQPRIDGNTSEARGAAMVKFVANLRPDPKQESSPKEAAPCYAARLVLGVDTDYALAKLDAAASNRIARAKASFKMQAEYDAAPDKSKVKRPGPPLDPFDKAALVNTYFLGKSRIPPSIALKIRDYVALYNDHRALTGYARGAWNYKLMMDASGFLAAEEWPEIVDRAGLNASQIRDATRQRLFAGFSEICKLNFSEYGATIYNGVNLSAIRMLAEFAKDAEMRNRARITLDAMMLDIACTWNQGYNVGSASRAKYWYSTDTGTESMASTAAAAWVQFGAPRPIATAGLGYSHAFWMATPGTYRTPEIIRQVATRRSEPFLHQSYIAGMPTANIHRMTWHSPHYSLCSQWDQAGEPTSGLYKESRRHMLKWVSDKPSSTFVVCMENPARPYALQEKRANAIGYGENGFSQYMQHQGTLLGLYAVPPQVKVRNRVFDYNYYKLYAPFPATGSILKRTEKDGWVFCHNGSMLMAFRSLKPCHWGKKWGAHDMLWCDARQNGWILETSELTPYAGGGPDAELERFSAAILSQSRIDATAIDAPVPSFQYRSLSGRQMSFRWQPHRVPYTDQLQVDGKPLVFSKEWLQLNPMVSQKTNGPLKISIGSRSLVYDFDQWTMSPAN